MSNLSEEKILSRIKLLIEYGQETFNDFDYVRPVDITIEQRDIDCLQGLLALYNKEKEKNKRNKRIILDKLDKLKNGIENDFPITLGKRQPLWEENKTDYISKDNIIEKIKDYDSKGYIEIAGALQELLEERN